MEAQDPKPRRWLSGCRSGPWYVEEGFGTEKAMGYLIGEKFLNFLERAETDCERRQAIPAFVAEIRSIFEAWQLAEFLNTPRRLGAAWATLLPTTKDTTDAAWMLLDESEKGREDARNLMLLEWAKELLLEESDQ